LNNGIGTWATRDVVDIIQNAAHTGNAGDEKIIVYTVDSVVKTRTSERPNLME